MKIAVQTPPMKRLGSTSFVPAGQPSQRASVSNSALTEPLHFEGNKKRLGVLAGLGLALTSLLTACGGSGPLGLPTAAEQQQAAASREQRIAATCPQEYRERALGLEAAGALEEGMQIACSEDDYHGAHTFATIPYPPPAGSAYERALEGTVLDQTPGQ